MPHTYLNWPGFSAENTVIINVDKDEFGIQSRPVEYAGKVFMPKRETHVTVFGSTLGTALLQQILHNPEVEQQIRQAFESTDWCYTKTTDLRHLIRQRSGQTAAAEESIIMLLDMEGMASFYQKLKALGLIDNEHPLPPPHVTLYTRNSDTGIGVHSANELIELCSERLEKPV